MHQRWLFSWLTVCYKLVCCRHKTDRHTDNYCTSLNVKLAFFTAFVLTLQIGFAARWCFWFSANDSSIEQVCPPLVYTMCKEAWVKQKHCCQQSAFSATNAKGVQMGRTTRPFAQWNLTSRICNSPKHWKNTKTRSCFN